MSVILFLCNTRWHEPGAQHAENACGNGHSPEVIQADLRRHERIGKRQLRSGQERQLETGEGDKFQASAGEALEEWDQAHEPENAAGILKEGHFGFAHQCRQDLICKGV